MYFGNGTAEANPMTSAKFSAKGEIFWDALRLSEHNKCKKGKTSQEHLGKQFTFPKNRKKGRALAMRVKQELAYNNMSAEQRAAPEEIRLEVARLQAEHPTLIMMIKWQKGKGFITADQALEVWLHPDLTDTRRRITNHIWQRDYNSRVRAATNTAKTPRTLTPEIASARIIKAPKKKSTLKNPNGHLIINGCGVPYTLRFLAKKEPEAKCDKAGEQARVAAEMKNKGLAQQQAAYDFAFTAKGEALREDIPDVYRTYVTFHGAPIESGEQICKDGHLKPFQKYKT